MKSTKYPIEKKLETLHLLDKHSLREASEISGIPSTTIYYWKNQRHELEDQYYRHIDERGEHDVLVSQKDIAQRIQMLTESINSESIQNAPLNHKAAALGVLIDRYLRIQDAKNLEQQTQTEKVIRIEYVDALTGKVTDTPPWASASPQSDESLQRGLVWQTLRQDRTSEDSHHRNGDEG